MDDENKYHWTFRQTVGRGYTGKPRYHEYSFGSLRLLLGAIIFFNLSMIKRAWKNGWKNRWEC